MSLEAWKEAYYPIEAYEAAFSPDREQVQHCLQKWRGLLPQTLDAHGISVFRPDAYAVRLKDDDSDSTFRIDLSTCALCLNHNNEPECETCPIVKATGDTCISAFKEFRGGRDPRSMIAVLERTLEHVTEAPQ